MSILLVKTVMSCILVISAIIALYSMFEIIGRTKPIFKAGRMMIIHRINGILYFIVFVTVSYFCLSLIVETKAELSARSTFHSIYAISIIALICLKMAFIKLYRGLYDYAKLCGIIIVLLTLLLAGTSGGYYLLVSDFSTATSSGSYLNYDNVFAQNSSDIAGEPDRSEFATDSDSVEKGRQHFKSKCSYCHDAFSNRKLVAPCLKEVLKREFLPVSKRPT